MKIAEIKTTITQLVQFITNDSTQNQLGLSMTHFFWPDTQTWKPMIAELDDVGDYHTFVAWAGKLLNQPSWIHFPKEQLQRWQKNFQDSQGFYQTQVDCQSDKQLSSAQQIIKSVSVYDLQDLILGLYELEFLTSDILYKQELMKQFNLLKKVAARNRNVLPNKILKPSLLALPWASTSSAVNGLIAEHALLAGKRFKDQSLVTLGHQLIKAQLESSLWLTQQLFSQGQNCYLASLSPYRQAKIMKEQSNMLYAMIQDVPHYKEQLHQMLNSLLQFKHASGAFFSYWDINQQQALTGSYDKTHNFAAIDMLLELHRAGVDPKTSLQVAEKCVQFWLSYKDPGTQLFPDYINSDGTVSFPIAKLDQTADFYSSLLRLYSITGNKEYLKEARVGAIAMAETFGVTAWWHRIINIQTGKPPIDAEVPVKDQPHGRNLTKYVGGALRFYLSLHEVLSGKHMYDNELLWLMSRDR